MYVCIFVIICNGAMTIIFSLWMVRSCEGTSQQQPVDPTLFKTVAPCSHCTLCSVCVVRELTMILNNYPCHTNSKAGEKPSNLPMSQHCAHHTAIIDVICMSCVLLVYSAMMIRYSTPLTALWAAADKPISISQTAEQNNSNCILPHLWLYACC